MRAKHYFNSINENRKSNINVKTNKLDPKTDVLTYLNLLDKCTQILREDRLWVRNQLKNGNEQLITIFKNIKKPLNLQHLQIKLRKHITGVKSKAKMEQLMKFKQNMSLGEQPKYQPPQHQNRSQPREPKISYEKHHIGGGTYSSSVDKGYQKTTYTLDKFKRQNNQKFSPFPYQTNTYKFEEKHSNLNDEEIPMEKITERDSENITSARHRAIYEDNFITKNIQNINSELVQEEKSFNYKKWERPHMEAKNNFLNEIKNFVDRKFQLPGEEIEHEMFQKKENEEIVYNQSVEEMEREEESSEPFSEDKRKPSIVENEEVINSQNFLFNERNFVKEMPSHFESIKEEKKPYEREFEYDSYLLSSNKRNDEDLFTSPQLLMECRKFINKTNSNSKQKPYVPYEPEIASSFLENKILEIQPLKMEEEKEKSPPIIHTFADKIKEQIKYTYKEPQYSFPQAIEHKQVPIIEKQDRCSHNYQYFQTFAASNQKQPNFVKDQPKSWPAPEQVVDQLINNYSSQYISEQMLIETVTKNYPDLSSEFREQFKDSNVSVAEVGRFLERITQKKIKRENEVQSIYCLLDIEKKGCIIEDDIQNFLDQFYEAETQNIDQIAQLLWSIFDGASELTSDHRKFLDYWGMYSIKQSEEFRNLYDILHEYEFEIDAPDQDEEFN